MATTKIEWAEKSWNPIVGCSKVSDGCRYCYAEVMANRLKAMGKPEYQDVIDNGKWTGKVQWVSRERMMQPLRWKKPSRIFVNSMSDLFHPDVKEDLLSKIFDVMGNLAPQHTYIVLTKRPARMALWITKSFGMSFPYKNIWLGTSVENQEMAEKRIPFLLATPAAVRFVSCEPLLGDLNISQYLYGKDSRDYGCDEDGLEWVIVGGESGPNARPMHPDWARSVRDQCEDAGVPFFFKSFGEWLFVHPDRKSYEYSSPPKRIYVVDNTRFYKVGKKKAGRLLDGKEWNQFPGDEE